MLWICFLDLTLPLPLPLPLIAAGCVVREGICIPKASTVAFSASALASVVSTASAAASSVSQSGGAGPNSDGHLLLGISSR